jgi:hypothetical protein
MLMCSKSTQLYTFSQYLISMKITGLLQTESRIELAKLIRAKSSRSAGSINCFVAPPFTDFVEQKCLSLKESGILYR